jgi:hypothetical protein
MVGERLVQTAATIEARWWYFLAFNPRRAAHTSSHRFGIELHMHTLPLDLGDRTRREKEMAQASLLLSERKCLKQCIPEAPWAYLDTGFGVPEVDPPDVADIHTVC